jgi:hypothetical protein
MVLRILFPHHGFQRDRLAGTFANSSEYPKRVPAFVVVPRGSTDYFNDFPAGSGILFREDSAFAIRSSESARMRLHTNPANPKIHPTPKINERIRTTIRILPRPWEERPHGGLDRYHSLLYGSSPSSAFRLSAAKCADREGSDAPTNHPAAMPTAAKRNTIR